jgi:hypothetical protein
MDVYDTRRAFLTELHRHQHIEVEVLTRDLRALNTGHVADPERTPLRRCEVASGLLHDAQAVESYLKRTLAAYPERLVAS